MILAIDQGTTGTKVLLIDPDFNVRAVAYRRITSFYPQPGWVEQDPAEIWQKSLEAIEECLARAGVKASEIKGIGIDDQGETVLFWDRLTGRPVYNAISWQCRRTTDYCQYLAARGYEALVHEKTGLRLDPYFSASKIAWVLREVPEARDLLRQNRLVCGTTDTWLVWNLTAGAVHVTDYSTASRTSLFNIHSLSWDNDLLSLFELPKEILPTAMPSMSFFGETADKVIGAHIPIVALVVDQQAALFGHCCFAPGTVKATYGTGCFVLMNIGREPKVSRYGLLTTVAWAKGNEVIYALDGGIYVAGAVVDWLVDVGLLASAAESAATACQAQQDPGLFFVPALAGIGCPYWDARARGTIIGLTRGTTREQLVRSALEGVAYRVRDVIEAMEKDAGLAISVLRADGGASANSFLMQFQADILGIPVEVSADREITARGTGLLAGLSLGLWTEEELAPSPRRILYEPGKPVHWREERYARWREAVRRALNWETLDGETR